MEDLEKTGKDVDTIKSMHSGLVFSNDQFATDAVMHALLRNKVFFTKQQQKILVKLHTSCVIQNCHALDLLLSFLESEHFNLWHLSEPAERDHSS